MEQITTFESTEVAASTLQQSAFTSFLEYIDRNAKTTATYLTNLKQFAAYLSFKSIDRPTRQDVINYRDYLGAPHEAIMLVNGSGWAYRLDNAGNRITISLKANTVAQYLRTVAEFFKWTAAAGVYPNIAANVHAPKLRHDIHKKDALTAADVYTIEQSITSHAAEKAAAAALNQKDTAGRIDRATEQGARLYAMYLLAVTAGLRTIELERANIRDLEVKGGNACLYVWGKGHSEPDQKKPLAKEVYAAIKEYLNIRSDRPTGSSPLFVSTGNRSGGKRIAARTISTMLKAAMKAAGYDSERLTAHSLRHTAGTTAMLLSNDLYLTQRYMRHTAPSTTEIYLQINTEDRERNLAQIVYNEYHSNISFIGTPAAAAAV